MELCYRAFNGTPRRRRGKKLKSALWDLGGEALSKNNENAQPTRE
jgi:hypothetical protein